MPPEKLSMRILFNFQKEIWLISSPAAQDNFFQVFSISKPGGFAAESTIDWISMPTLL
jgi:hypothetical protein